MSGILIKTDQFISIIAGESFPQGVSQPTNTTGVTASDGVRLGVLGSANANASSIGLLYQQENRPLLFSTNANSTRTNAVNTLSA